MLLGTAYKLHYRPKSLPPVSLGQLRASTLSVSTASTASTAPAVHLDRHRAASFSELLLFFNVQFCSQRSQNATQRSTGIITTSIAIRFRVSMSNLVPLYQKRRLSPAQFSANLIYFTDAQAASFCAYFPSPGKRAFRSLSGQHESPIRQLAVEAPSEASSSRTSNNEKPMRVKIFSVMFLMI